ncbi:MAG TPA: toll/interleukin-1 receptor domain-containing protein [Terracidiphilus sp.]
MPRILVNYRRDDSAPYAGRLADRLKKHFGSDHVFVDIDNIRPGEDFVQRIDQSIAACDVLVAVIGKSWLTAADSQGHRRLDREDDFVRMEIAKALECHRRVIPALVGDATMPAATQLPQDLVALSRKQAVEISDSRFHQDVDNLIEALADSPGLSPQPKLIRQPLRERGRQVVRTLLRKRWIVGAAIAIAALFLIGYWFSRSRNTPSAQSTAAESTSTTPGSLASAGNGELSAPAMDPPPAGKTGIQVVWRGSTSVPCYLFDETGTKALSPESVVFAWQCARDQGLWDAAPGKYQIKFGEVADTMPPMPITVTKGQVVRAEPPVGQLRLHWNGSNRIAWYLLDQTGQKTLSPASVVFAWACEAGAVCTRDLGPGSYLLKVDAAGYQPVKVTIKTFRITDVSIP